MIALDMSKPTRYGFFVQRVTLQPVTEVPLIVPCKDGEPHDGHANFNHNEIAMKIRIVKDDELKDLKKALSPSEANFLADCLALKHAYNAKDPVALERPYNRLWPHLVSGIPGLDDSAAVLTKIFSSTPNWVPVCLPQLVSNKLCDVRLVLWWFGFDKEEMFERGKFTPAFFCPDLKTALFFKGLLGQIRICPRCEKVFVPRKGNIDYCSPAHRDAHRVARWRAQKQATAVNAKGASAAKRRRTTSPSLERLLRK